MSNSEFFWHVGPSHDQHLRSSQVSWNDGANTSLFPRSPYMVGVYIEESGNGTYIILG